MKTELLVALGGFLVAFVTLLLSARKDTRGDAANQAQTMAKLDSIAGGVDDYAERLARVEDSVKSAHHRLDQIAAPPSHPPGGRSVDP